MYVVLGQREPRRTTGVLSTGRAVQIVPRILVKYVEVRWRGTRWRATRGAVARGRTGSRERTGSGGRTLRIRVSVSSGLRSGTLGAPPVAVPHGPPPTPSPRVQCVLCRVSAPPLAHGSGPCRAPRARLRLRETRALDWQWPLADGTSGRAARRTHAYIWQVDSDTMFDHLCLCQGAF